MALYASETWKSTRRNTEEAGRVSSTELRKIIGVSWKDKVTITDVLKRTEVAARYRRREEIPVCGTRPSDGTRTPSSQCRLDTSQWQEKKRQVKEDLAVNIL